MSMKGPTVAVSLLIAAIASVLTMMTITAAPLGSDGSSIGQTKYAQQAQVVVATTAAPSGSSSGASPNAGYSLPVLISGSS